MFRGVANLNLDNKGRLAVPAKHRDRLLAKSEGRLVLTADPSKSLLLYPEGEWEPIQQKLMTLSSFKPEIRALQRLLVGYAEDVEMDAAGRVLVPPPLREFAGLDKRIVLVGQGNRFELWDEARWRQELTTAVGLTQLPAELDGFSL